MVNTVEFIVEGQSIGLSKYFKTLRLQDYAKANSDSFTIELSDPHRELVEPSTWKKINILVNGIDKGTYEINELSGDIHGTRYDISGTAIQTQGNLTNQRSRSFTGLSVGEILSDIASAHGYDPVCDSDIGAIVLDQINQMGESDLNLLNRLAGMNGGNFKLNHECMIISKNVKGENVRGEKLPTLLIDDPAVTSGSYTKKSREKVSAVRASWFNEETNTMEYEAVGSGSTITDLPKQYANKEEALKAAQSRLTNANSDDGELTIDMPLVVEFTAGCVVKVSNHAGAVNGDWVIDSIEHNISCNQYDSSVLKMVKPG